MGVFVAFLCAIASVHAQTITYQDLETNGTSYDTTGDTLVLSIDTGSARQYGVIHGTGGLTKSGAGSLTLTGNNTYTGTTRLEAGILRAEFSSTLGNSSGEITFAGGVLRLETGGDVSGRIRNSTSAIAINTSGTSITFSNVLDSSNTGGLTKSGSGVLQLLGRNTYTGITRLEAGTLRLYSSNALGGTFGDDITFAGGTLEFSGSTTDYSSRIKNSTGAIAIKTSLSSAFPVVFASSLDSSNTGGLIKSGTGTLTLSGDNAYSGGTTINAGLVKFATDANLGTDNLTLDGGGLQWATGATTDISSRLNALGAAGATFDTNGNNVTFASALSGTGDLTKSGAGTLTLSGTNTYSGGTTITAGLVNFATDSNLGTGNLTLNGGGLQWATDATTDISSRLNALGAAGATFDTNGNNVTFASALSGTGGLTKSGAGTLTLAATNTYTGTTRLEAGALSLGSAGALGDTTGGDITFAGGTLQYGASPTTNYSARIKNSTGAIAIDTNGYNVGFGSLASSNTGGLIKSGAGTLNLFGTNAYTGTTRLEAGTLRTFGLSSSGDAITFAGGTLQLDGGSDVSGRIRNSTGAIAINTSGPAITFSNVLDSSNTGGLTKSGSGALQLLARNTYTGITRLEAGTLRLYSSNALGGTFGGSTGDDITFAGGTLEYSGSTTDYSSRIKNSTGAIAIKNSLFPSSPLHFASSLDSSNTGGLTKSGTGTLVLVGDNAYSGGTTVTAGLLVVNGSLGNTVVIVASGATLGGSGTIGGLTTLTSGAHLAPGNSPGTLTFTNGLTLDGGSILDFELGSTSDKIVVTGGTLTGPASGTITLNFTDAGGFAAGSYMLFDFSSGGTTTNSFDISDFALGSTIAGFSYTLGFSDGTLQLTASSSASAVPEPATCAVVTSAVALGLALLRRRGRGGRIWL